MKEQGPKYFRFLPHTHHGTYSLSLKNILKPGQLNAVTHIPMLKSVEVLEGIEGRRDW